MTEDKLSVLIDCIQSQQYDLGKIVGAENLSDEIMELASNAFMVGDDKIAKYLRDLANGIKGKAKDDRGRYSITSHLNGQEAIDELYTVLTPKTKID